MQNSSQKLQNMFIFDTPIHVESDTWASLSQQRKRFNRQKMTNVEYLIEG